MPFFSCPQCGDRVYLRITALRMHNADPRCSGSCAHDRSRSPRPSTAAGSRVQCACGCEFAIKVESHSVRKLKPKRSDAPTHIDDSDESESLPETQKQH